MTAYLVRRAVLALTLTGIPTSVIAQNHCVTTQDHIVVNTKIVRKAGANDLLELIRRHVSSHRIVLAESSDSQPLVVVDGVALYSGVQRLADIRLDDVVAVMVLRNADATARFGRRGQHGAIVVTTKNGLALICSRQPSDPF